MFEQLNSKFTHGSRYHNHLRSELTPLFSGIWADSRKMYGAGIRERKSTRPLARFANASWMRASLTIDPGYLQRVMTCCGLGAARMITRGQFIRLASPSAYLCCKYLHNLGIPHRYILITSHPHRRFHYISPLLCLPVQQNIPTLLHTKTWCFLTITLYKK